MKTTLRILIILPVLLCMFQYMVAQSVTDPSVQDPGYDARKRLSVQNNKSSNNRIGNNTKVATATNSAASQSALEATCFVPLDTSYLPVPRNDDGYFGPIALPFSFNLYGTSYTQAWINTNGNLTFTNGYDEYVPQGFPLSGVPMVAAFWADVDTRNTTGGQIHYKLTPTRLIVTWDKVGYYNQQANLLNTFQIIIGVQSDTLLGPGNNFRLNYGDVQWATSSGFGTSDPTTVGANSGSGGNFIQVGRFSQNNSNYDGPGGATDGINYLDNQCFPFNGTSNLNIAPSVIGFANGNAVTINPGDTISLSPQFIGPEVGQTVTTAVDTSGMCRVTYSITNGAVSQVNMRIIGDTCNVGTHTIRFTATDNGSPVQSTIVNYMVTVNKLNQVITFPPPVDDNGDGRISLMATAGSGLPVSYSIVSGPASVTGNTLLVNGVGLVTIRAFQEGNNIFNAAPSKDIILCIAPSQPGTITGHTEVCLNAQTTYSVTNIPGANFTWTVDAGATITYSGNSASVRWNTMGPHSISVSYTTNCGTVGAARSLAVNVTNKNLGGSFAKMLPSDRNVNIAFPINFSWFPITNAVAYDIYIWPESGTRPATPFIVNINAINYTLYSSNTLEFGKTYKWQVLARSTCDTLASQVQSFRLRYLPDLVVNNIQVPVSGFSGQSISIRWETKNTGQGATFTQQRWIDRIYLSRDQVLDDQDFMLGTASNVSELAPGQSYVNTGSFTLPQNVADPHYAIVVADAYNQVAETDQNNNTGASAGTAAIQLTPPPDLRVSAIIPPNFAFSGQDIAVSWRITNAGTGATLATAWTDQVYFSKDEQFNPANALFLGSFSHSGTLNVGDFYNKSATFRLPEGIFGRYFLYVQTDVGNNVFEHSAELNNTSRSDSLNVILTPPIDLVVAQVTAPAAASNGESITISWQVENAGGSGTEKRTWVDYIYLSPQAVFNPAVARFVGIASRPRGLAPGESYTTQQQLVVPAGITGNFYVHVQTDAAGQVFEYIYDNNNTRATAQPLNITTPDLIVAGMTIPAADTSGHTIPISWTIKNNGTGKIANTTVTDRILLSASASFNEFNSIQLKLFNFNAGELLAGKDTVLNTTVKLPEGISGNYYIYIQSDYGNTVFETDNSNNLRRSAGALAVTLGPWADLRLSTVQISDTATAMDMVPVSYTVINRGNKAVNGIGWKDRLYLSLKPQWDAAASTFIREVSQTRVVGKDSSYSVSTTIRLPNNARDTTYYLYVQTDAYNNIYEHTDEGNNIGRSNGVFVKKYPPVDLIVTSIAAPDSGSSGSLIKVKWAVKNQGLAATLQNQWTDALYLSADTVFDNGDRLVRDFSHRGVLAAGSAYTDEQSFMLPNGVSGSYYLLMVADRSDLNNDIDRSNNYKLIRQSSDGGGGIEEPAPEPLPIHIVLTTPPDLSVTAFQSPDEGTAGQPIWVKWTVKNIGAGVTPVNGWTDRVYLSTNLQLDGGDQFIGSYARTGLLEPSASYTDSLQVFLPVTATGNYVLIFKTDANDNVYEHGAEENTSLGLITITQAALSDLIVTDVIAPTSSATGDQVTFEWKVKNNGANPAYGYMQDGVYLSLDTVKDASDILLGSPAAYINLAPQASITQHFTAELKGVTLRDYHVLVHTDVLNNIAEQADTNNIGVSVLPLQVTVEELLLNILKQDSLPAHKEVYYRLQIPDSLAGESLLVSLQGDSARGNNELYVRFGDVPTRAVHDFAFNEPYRANQQTVVPLLKAGTYYVMIYGNAPADIAQPVTLLAQTLEFAITDIDAREGGNTGKVTVKIMGSKFEPAMQWSLTDSTGNNRIGAVDVFFVNPTLVYATFDLTGKPQLTYNLEAKATNGELALLNQCFRVVPAQLVNTVVEVIHVPNVRPNRVFSVTFRIRNNGNVDIPAPIYYVVGSNGAPVGMSQEDINNNILYPYVYLEFDEAHGPLFILRPGAERAITIYSKSALQDVKLKAINR